MSDSIRAVAPPGDQRSVKLEIEFSDGTFLVVREVQADEAWETIEVYEDRVGPVVSAWRDDAPWFGDCTYRREG
jgi:hypothetical protein